MMRPPSYREMPPEKRCENCLHSKYIRYKDDRLCFHGDDIHVDGGGFVFFRKRDISILGDEEYSDVWGGRVVDEWALCDLWEAMP